MQKIMQNEKPNLGPKMLIWALICRFEEVLSYFQDPPICQIAMFREKAKIFHFLTKNA